ncbi:uncharacterized protein LOC110862562 isoform X2 [Folsomia candida]|uniref:uncharacterized protein LOC110862562 isoform X2 n=1 Tax=Folsomia candida TaxID=158441 RepID=UPI000B8FA2A1|nr:uncharacterized protein LOC110862562 isoform X2 [Folsomia candida]
MKYQALALLLVDGLLLATCAPQGGYSSSRPSQSYGSTVAAPQELQGSAASFGPNSFAQQSTQSFGAFGGGGGGGGGGAGGNLQVECKRQEVSPGRFKFVCDGVNPNSIALRSEHILWLTGPEGQKQVVDIEVPNYKIEELIKAGFKSQPGEGTLINVLLRKPEQSYDAQVDQVNSVAGTPSVNLQYEPVEKTLVHFPTDKAYSPLQGPLIPPGGGRPQRQVQKNFSKPYAQVQGNQQSQNVPQIQQVQQRQ